jgi:hypothetical protein
MLLPSNEPLNKLSSQVTRNNILLPSLRKNQSQSSGKMHLQPSLKSKLHFISDSLRPAVPYVSYKGTHNGHKTVEAQGSLWHTFYSSSHSSVPADHVRFWFIFMTSVSRLYRRPATGWLINWKGFWSEQPWRYTGICLKGLAETTINAVTRDGVPGPIGTGNLQNTSVKRYRYANPLVSFSIRWPD